jgi:hypothetical protein
MNRLLAASILLAGAAAGCGGSGSDGGNDAPTATTAEGLWNGTTNSGRTTVGLVLDDGEYWVIYTLVGNNAVIAGAVQGDGESRNGSFTSSNGRDFNFEGVGVNDLTVDASYVMKQSFSGSLKYKTSGTQFTFAGTYDAAYELTPSLSSVAGSYTGSALTSGGVEFATTTISSSGSITGSSASGCSFSGSISPRAHGNVYNLTITFAGGVCANGSSTVTGVGYFDAGTKQIIAAGLNGSRTDGFISVGTKP